MNHEGTKKCFRQIENWRKEVSEKQLKHINNVTDKNILLHIAQNKLYNK